MSSVNRNVPFDMRSEQLSGFPNFSEANTGANETRAEVNCSPSQMPGSARNWRLPGPPMSTLNGTAGACQRVVLVVLEGEIVDDVVVVVGVGSVVVVTRLSPK